MDAELNPASGAGFELLALREWVKLLRHFELGEGFSFIILLASNRSLARRCLVELDLWLRIRRRADRVRFANQDSGRSGQPA